MRVHQGAGRPHSGGACTSTVTSYVGHGGEGRAADGDMDALATRWPAWHARLAGFLMHDPLRARRENLQRLYAELPPLDPQRVLFEA